MAERYGILPSELLNRGNSFDLMVIDVALTCHKYYRDKQEGKFDSDLMDLESLKAASERAKKRVK